MAQLRVLRANGLSVSEIHIEQSNRDKKQYIVDNIPKQTVATLSKAVGDSVETLRNIPSLSTKTTIVEFTALLLWTRVVLRMPVRRQLTLFAVKRCRRARKRKPKTLLRV